MAFLIEPFQSSNLRQLYCLSTSQIGSLAKPNSKTIVVTLIGGRPISQNQPKQPSFSLIQISKRTQKSAQLNSQKDPSVPKKDPNKTIKHQNDFLRGMTTLVYDLYIYSIIKNSSTSQVSMGASSSRLSQGHITLGTNNQLKIKLTQIGVSVGSFQNYKLLGIIIKNWV